MVAQAVVFGKKNRAQLAVPVAKRAQKRVSSQV